MSNLIPVTDTPGKEIIAVVESIINGRLSVLDLLLDGGDRIKEIVSMYYYYISSMLTLKFLIANNIVFERLEEVDDSIIEESVIEYSSSVNPGVVIYGHRFSRKDIVSHVLRSYSCEMLQYMIANRLFSGRVLKAILDAHLKVPQYAITEATIECTTLLQKYFKEDV